MPLSEWERKNHKVITESSDSKTKALLAASSSGEKLHIKYSKPNGVDERWITPIKVFSKKGEVENYLEASCHKKNARRVFMIKRITILNSGSGSEADSQLKKPSDYAVTTSTNYVELENDYGVSVDSVQLKCNRCGHVTESFGESSDSIKRCLALMKEECPQGESNWYVEE